MLVTLSTLLLVNGIFNVLVWPPFLRRVSADPRARDDEGNATKFLLVHRVLIALALVLAAVSLVTAVVGFVFATR